MSFILDQLNKSGKKRQLELAMRSKAESQRRETAGTSRPDIQPTSDHRIHKRGIYLLLFLAFASFSAVGGFILLRGNPDSGQPTVGSTKAQVYTAVPSVPKTEIAGPESVLPDIGLTSIPTKSHSGADPEKEVLAPAVALTIPAGKVKSSMPAAVAELRNQPEPTAQAQIPDPSPPEKPEMQEDAHSVPYLNELPASLKDALPPIRMTSHLYRGNSRLVSINGKIMSEGVSIGEGLFLDEITPDGAIMSFRGQRFRVRAD